MIGQDWFTRGRWDSVCSQVGAGPRRLVATGLGVLVLAGLATGMGSLGQAGPAAPAEQRGVPGAAREMPDAAPARMTAAAGDRLSPAGGASPQGAERTTDEAYQPPAGAVAIQTPYSALRISAPALPAGVAIPLPSIYGPWSAVVARGFVLRTGGRTWPVAGATLQASVQVGAPRVVFDPAPLAARIAAVAAVLDDPPRDARFRLVGGRVQVVAGEHDGWRVDQAASLAAARRALGAGQAEAELVVVAVPAAVRGGAGGQLPVPDLLGQASTSYQGSSAERAHNVEFGARLVDGALVAPGAEFDLNQTLGPLTLAAGFQMGFAIQVQDDNTVSTVPAEAGGICQVATTLFQSVFWAGLPITERHHHSYWIGSYGVAPSGLQGLDATIAPPDLDFRWRNTTGHWVLVRARAGAGRIHFELWGTDPHWQVRVSGPAISQVVPTSTQPIYERSTAVARGSTRLVEHAQAGFSADIHRRVFAAGALIDDWHAAGTYLPAHNRYLVGR